MKKKIISRTILVVILFCISYVGLFIVLHLITPDLGTVTIGVNPNDDNPEMLYVTLSIDKSFNQYYFLIYENNPNDNWIYFSPSIYIEDNALITKEFLPDDKNKYLLLEGDQYKNSFTFSIKSKYPISYMSSQEHTFHVYAIVPFKLFPFPTFYFNKHYVFFIDPLL